MSVCPHKIIKHFYCMLRVLIFMCQSINDRVDMNFKAPCGIVFVLSMLNHFLSVCKIYTFMHMFIWSSNCQFDF